ncbi:hypothetical protein BTJ68_11081 [Hortaea werneckii EXF-2000]|uniref:Uncharacterized protein n=1 Tax=Hortaea werneckii EXF-2000 TaxID=1157616 RepID=A0A1Z5SYA9_HORWE|nr:hypothetical protein BTJ68_11081 [Hortaea werneckii EXF-2000]
MKFRRSIKSDGGSKHDSAKPVQISIPQKDATAIEPPKKVIKALYDYNARQSQASTFPFPRATSSMFSVARTTRTGTKRAILWRTREAWCR